MAQDFAKKRGSGSERKKPPARKKAAPRKPNRKSEPATSGWRWYGAGVITGVFLCFLVYLGAQPSSPGGQSRPPGTENGSSGNIEAVPEASFDFYRLLPEQSIEVEVEVEPASVDEVQARAPASSEYYLLQAGSFRQREDADRRRAELLLLGLQPRVEEASGDNGRWFRVYLGPFDSRSAMSRARSLTADQGIDTLLLKRS